MKLSAYYSEEMAKSVQYCIYEDINGKEIKITEVVETHHDPVAKYPDLKFVGYVKRSGYKSTHLGPKGKEHEYLMEQMEDEMNRLKDHLKDHF